MPHAVGLVRLRALRLLVLALRAAERGVVVWCGSAGEVEIRFPMRPAFALGHPAWAVARGHALLPLGVCSVACVRTYMREAVAGDGKGVDAYMPTRVRWCRYPVRCGVAILF